MSLCNFKQTTSLVYLAIPRIVLGCFFIYFAWGKLNPHFLSGQPLAASLAKATSDPLSWHRDFILHTVVPNSRAFSYLSGIGEMAIGISLLLGFLVRFSSFFGILYNLNIYLAIGIPAGGAQEGLNRIFIVLQLMFLLAAAGRALGLDGVFKKAFPHSRLF